MKHQSVAANGCIDGDWCIETEDALSQAEFLRQRRNLLGTPPR